LSFNIGLQSSYILLQFHPLYSLKRIRFRPPELRYNTDIYLMYQNLDSARCVQLLLMLQKREASPPEGVLAVFIILIISIAQIFDHGVEHLCSQPLRCQKNPMRSLLSCLLTHIKASLDLLPKGLGKKMHLSLSSFVETGCGSSWPGTCRTSTRQCVENPYLHLQPLICFKCSLHVQSSVF
jgi:hypothetical protein